MAIIGQLLPKRFPFDPLAFGLGIAREFGDMAHYRAGPLHVYLLNHPDLVRQILTEQPEKYYKPRLIKWALRPIGGEGLLTSDGPFWKQQRKLVQPAFHPRQLAAYGDVMVAHATRVMDGFAEGEVREIGGPVRAVLDAVNERVNSPLRIPSWVPTERNRREKRAIKSLDAILNELIRTRRDSAESRDDLLSALLAAVAEDGGARMADRQLRDEMMTLFMAGHETTASAMTWTWYLLSRHPKVEAKLAEELQRVLGGRAPLVRDLANLPYSEMVIREALRLYPPAPGFAREPIEDVTIGGFEVPKGSLVTVSTYALQRDARFYHDPERFDPERFARGWEDRIPRYAYLPFGGGPRICIGSGFAMMEARLILATVAQRYKLAVEAAESIRPVQMVTLRPSGPVRVRVERR